MHWLKELKNCLLVNERGRQVRMRLNEPLNTHTTLRIGGPADIWVEPNDDEELRGIIYYCAEREIPYLVIGRGSNILPSDRGFKGIVICLDSPTFTKIKFKGKRLICGAGLPLQKMIRQAQKRGLGGLEFLAGIPASAGGALVMNAGNQQKGIGSFVESVTVMNHKGKTSLLKKKQLKFGYRQSNLNRYIVLKAQLRLIKRSPWKIKEDITLQLKQKKKAQDVAAKSAGCIFKNPRHRLTAGEMIAACGLKRRRYGGAQISAKHANYIINRNGAKARDVLYLMKLAQRQVKKKFGIFLKPEIRIVQ